MDNTLIIHIAKTWSQLRLGLLPSPTTKMEQG